jgi:acyl-CoA thioesterase-1
MVNRRRFLNGSSLAFLSVLFPLKIFPSKSRLPNVLIIGDSISIGYYPFVKEKLKGIAKLHRPMLPEGGFQNCAGTTRGVEKIDQWIGETKWDLIHFNFGLHDIKHIDPLTGKNSKSFDDPHQASPDQYEKNLNLIVKKLKNTKAKLIFASTTPYPDEGLKPARKPGMHKIYNSIALRVMKKNKIFINDLHAFVMPRIKELQRPNNVHFSIYGSEELSKAVVESILKHL